MRPLNDPRKQETPLADGRLDALALCLVILSYYQYTICVTTNRYTMYWYTAVYKTIVLRIIWYKKTHGREEPCQAANHDIEPVQQQQQAPAAGSTTSSSSSSGSKASSGRYYGGKRVPRHVVLATAVYYGAYSSINTAVMYSEWMSHSAAALGADNLARATIQEACLTHPPHAPSHRACTVPGTVSLY